MDTQPLKSAEQLVARAIAIAGEGRRKTVAVAAAQDVAVIDAVAQAVGDGFVNGVLVGDQSKIKSLAESERIDLSRLKIIDQPDIAKAAHAAVRLAAEGEADIIMKGFLPTSAILKTVLDRQYNLRGMPTLSHCAVLDIPGYHKLLNFTDGGMVVKPTPEQKYELVENATLVGRALGLSPVKIALSVVRDEVTLTDITMRLENVAVAGPLSFEAATSGRAAAAAGIRNEVAGDADIYVVDSIEECNVVAKSLINFANTIFAGIIVGARVPVSLVSRTDSVKNKLASLAVACVLSDYYQQSGIWEERQ